MTQYDPNTDPTRPTAPVYTETVETVVVRESNTGWWIAGILGGVVLVAVLWILFARGSTPQTDAALLEAQVDAAQAQAQADQAVVQGQIAGAQASAEIARADVARSRADAAQAQAEARAAEARADAQATTPLVVEVQSPDPVTPAERGAVVRPTSPQN